MHRTRLLPAWWVPFDPAAIPRAGDGRRSGQRVLAGRDAVAADRRPGHRSRRQAMQQRDTGSAEATAAARLVPAQRPAALDGPA